MGRFLGPSSAIAIAKQGFFGISPAGGGTTNFTHFVAGGPNSGALWTGAPIASSQTTDFGGFGNGTTSGLHLGSTTPAIALINGQRVVTCGWADGVGGTFFLIAVAGTQVQSFFTSIAVPDQGYVLTTATATFFNTTTFPGVATGWFWAVADPVGSLGGHNVTIT